MTATKKKTSTYKKKSTKPASSKSSSTKSTQKRSVKQPAKTSQKSSKRSDREGLEWLVLFLLCFISFTLIAPGLFGSFGSFISKLFLGLFGIGAYPLLLTSCLYLLLRMIFPKAPLTGKYIALCVLSLLLSAFCHLLNGKEFVTLAECYKNATPTTGGWFGGLIGNGLVKLLDYTGSYILLGGLALILIGIVIGVSVKQKLRAASEKSKERMEQNAKLRAKEREEARKQREKEKSEKAIDERVRILQEEAMHSNPQRGDSRKREEQSTKTDKEANLGGRLKIGDDPIDSRKPVNTPVQAPVQENDTKKEEEPAPARKKAENEGTKSGYIMPPYSLLKAPSIKNGSKNNKNDLYQNAKKLEDTLMSFGVEATVTQINCGPTVTCYELQPKTGVKVSKIVNLSNDIALSMAAQSVRIEAPIPGKSAVGIEIPNTESSVVTLREVLESNEFKKAESKLTVALGRDISGNIRVADLTKMPHLLIAGATNSGKSVCINSFIISLLYKADPKDVQLVLIDPKVVELSVYNGIPHLCTTNRAVVISPKAAAQVLDRMVEEMGSRYKRFAELNVRNFQGYNEAVENMHDENYQKMPHIVIIIDELADLMMEAPKQVEEDICRLAQMARAAGMHLVIATQSPRVDVITGLIKANIPSRLAFAVSSGIDSRIILDMVGAEKLLGKGDMLFSPIGSSKPTRIQGAFVSDQEVNDVVKNISAYTSPDNLVEVKEGEPAGEQNEFAYANDDKLDEAIELVLKQQKVSISMIQRFTHVGFNRASDMVDEMARRGIISEDVTGSGKRQVIMTYDEYMGSFTDD